MRAGAGPRQRAGAGGDERVRAKHWVVVEFWWISVPDIVDHAWRLIVDIPWDADPLDAWIARGALDGNLRAARKRKNRQL